MNLIDQFDGTSTSQFAFQIEEKRTDNDCRPEITIAFLLLEVVGTECWLLKSHHECWKGPNSFR